MNPPCRHKPQEIRCQLTSLIHLLAPLSDCEYRPSHLIKRILGFFYREVEVSIELPQLIYDLDVTHKDPTIKLNFDNNLTQRLHVLFQVITQVLQDEQATDPPFGRNRAVRSASLSQNPTVAKLTHLEPRSFNLWE